MITLTFSIVVILQMCSIANQVHYFHCQQWAHLEEIQLHAKDNNLLCSICPFQSHFVVASMISFIHPRLIHTKLWKPTLPVSILFIRKYLLSMSTSQTLSLPTCGGSLAKMFFLSALSVKPLPNLYGLVHILASFPNPVTPALLFPQQPIRAFILLFGSDSSINWAGQGKEFCSFWKE